MIQPDEIIEKGLYATMNGWRMDPFSYLILPSNQPVPFPYHPVLWQGWMILKFFSYFCKRIYMI